MHFTRENVNSDLYYFVWDSKVKYVSLFFNYMALQHYLIFGGSNILSEWFYQIKVKKNLVWSAKNVEIYLSSKECGCLTSVLCYTSWFRHLVFLKWFHKQEGWPRADLQWLHRAQLNSRFNEVGISHNALFKESRQRGEQLWWIAVDHGFASRSKIFLHK